ncbi:MAG: hypothetical protein IJW99_08195 [Clostridia bacterium]|nr:hypothetical protein [Clostridia bacterium]
MVKHLDISELNERISLNFNRLANSDYYQIGRVFSPADYEWYGDKEGRALLAFVCHYRISGKVIPCMQEMMRELPERLNSKGYFGPVFDGKTIHEQQLSGHSWLLRGLCEHYEAFGDSYSLEMIRKISENLYLPITDRISGYPIHRADQNDGGVSGSRISDTDGWILSSDTGCAFMSIDGLAHVFRVTGDERVKKLLDEMISVYLAIDKVALKAQTHCTLTAARGMMMTYGETQDAKYLKGAESILDLYVNGGGMTETYQNLNWWNKPDTWTEPCAIVDSLMLALDLYKTTGKPCYRTIAARVYHNGLATAQRSNGGAGTDQPVVKGLLDTLCTAGVYEAYFCCTMRLAEGLRYIKDHAKLLYAELDGTVSQKNGVYSDGDIMYAEVSPELEAYAERFTEVDGHRLCPIVKYFKVPEDIAKSGKQRIIF